MIFSVDNWIVVCFQFCLKQLESSCFLKGCVNSIIEFTTISIASSIFPVVSLLVSQESFLKSRQFTIVGFEVEVGERFTNLW